MEVTLATATAERTDVLGDPRPKLYVLDEPTQVA